MEIEFQEDNESGYKSRTQKNATADVTIAIAFDFNSAGEKLTKKSVQESGGLYFPVEITKFGLQTRVSDVISHLSLSIKALNKSEITLNIAGNGIYTLKDTTFSKQSICDYFTYHFLQHLVNDLNRHKENGLFDTKIISVRTGGQTGFDEAGAKAAIKIGIPTLVLAPKGWEFRDENGNDIYNEEAFKKRFNEEK